MIRSNRNILNIPAAMVAGGVLVLCLLACSGRGSEAAEKTEKRGDITIEYYAPQRGIGHGDGKPGGCTILFKGERYNAPPMVKDGGRIFRCDLKPDSDEAVVRIAFYRPETKWTCGTRFGYQQAKCLPDSYEPVGGILTVKNGELALEEHGFWDVTYDWGEHSVKFADGREFDYKARTWTGCGDQPLKFMKTGALTVAKGRTCKDGEWMRAYVNGKEVSPEGSQGHAFDSVNITLNAAIPAATAWMGSVKGFIYIRNGKAEYMEVPESPDFLEDGKKAKWWSEDYQTRYTMDLTTFAKVTQTRPEVHEELEKSNVERDRLRAEGPTLISDDFSKIEVHSRDKHNQFYFMNLKQYTDIEGTGVYPYGIKNLVSSTWDSSVYYVFLSKNAVETRTINDKCIGTYVTSIAWIKTDSEMILKDAKVQIVSSCEAGSELTGEPMVSDGKLSVRFTDKNKKRLLSYDNRSPAGGFTVE